MYYDTTQKKSFIYDGIEWKVIATDGKTGGILDMRYGDGENFTHEVDVDSEGKEIIYNIGVPEGSYIGYKIVDNIPTDQELLVSGIYETYAWNDYSTDFIPKEQIIINNERFYKYYNKDYDRYDCSPSSFDFRFEQELNNILTPLTDERYYYGIVFYQINNETGIIYGNEYQLYSGVNISVPIQELFITYKDLSSCQITLYILLQGAYIPKLTKTIYFDYAMTDNMAKFALNAADITASINETKLKFSEDGLEVYGTGFKMYPNQTSNSPSLFADEFGNLNIKGNIEALTGSIGGWKINTGELYSTCSTDEDANIKVGLVGLPANDNVVIYAGRQPIMDDSGEEKIEYALSITEDGYITAKQADIKGAIHSTSGTITNNLQIGNDTTGITIFGADDGVSYIGTSSFASGALGSGWKIDSTGAAEFTNITARGKIASSVFEYNKISAIGGSLYIAPTVYMNSRSEAISQSSIEEENGIQKYLYTVSWIYEGDFSNAGGRTWLVKDEVRLEGICMVDNKQYELSDISATLEKIEVDVNKTSTEVSLSFITPNNLNLEGGFFIEGSLLIFYGAYDSTTSTTLKSGIFLTAIGNGAPFIDVYDITGRSNMPAVRMGNLNGITNTLFSNAPLKGYGLYSTNAYLTGEMILPNAGITNQMGIGYNGDDSYIAANDINAIRLWAGGEYPQIGNTVAPFIVTQDGSVYASKGIFKGTILATDGYFSGIIESAGIVIDRINDDYNPKVAKDHFFVAYNNSPQTYEDYVLNIDKNGLSIWEGALRIYSDEATEDIGEAYAYYNLGENQGYSSPLPYLFFQDEVDKNTNQLKSRMVSYSLHNLQLANNQDDYNYSIILNKGIWFNRQQQQSVINQTSIDVKKGIEQQIYSNNSYEIGIKLNEENTLELVSKTNIQISPNNSFIITSATKYSHPEGAQIFIGDFLIEEIKVKDSNSNNTITLGINII